MIRRLTASLAHLRPRTLAKTHKVVDDLVIEARELKRAAKLSADRHQATDAKADQRAEETRGQLAGIGQDLTEIRKMLAALTLRESQLRAIAQADAALEEEYDALGGLLDHSRIGDHVRAAFARAELHLDPFPYAVIDRLFPTDFFNALVRGIPPVELFEDGRVNKQQLVVPFAMAPAYSRRVWTFMVDVVAPHMIAPALVEKFRAPLEEWIRLNWPALAADPLGTPMEMDTSDGRIMLRRRGYNIPPHRDPKWGFLTCLIYLPRPQDPETWGTQLYSVEKDDEARGAAPHWVKGDRCRFATEVPFRRNTALVFLNSVGAHGASIPEDAEPADLQRYAYQFRVGPTRAAIAALMELMPDDRRPAWAGKITDY